MLRSLGKIVLAGVAAAVLASGVPAQAADDEVKIGLLFDVTGPVANFVPPMLDAAKLAIDQVNAQGGILGGKKLVSIVADTQGSPQDAALGVHLVDRQLRRIQHRRHEIGDRPRDVEEEADPDLVIGGLGWQARGEDHDGRPGQNEFYQ